MLDACAELVDEVGYEGLTTTLLAERAEVAIGSVYQFFPDKRAIVQALAMRNMDAYLQSLSARFGSETFAHWWDGVDAAIDAYIHMHRSVPGFRTLHFGDVVDLHLLDADRDNNVVIAERLAELLIDQFGAGVEHALDPGNASALHRNAPQRSGGDGWCRHASPLPLSSDNRNVTRINEREASPGRQHSQGLGVLCDCPPGGGTRMQ